MFVFLIYAQKIFSEAKNYHFKQINISQKINIYLNIKKK